MLINIVKIFSVISLITVSIMAYADDDHDQAKRLMDAGDILPLKVILQKARKTHQGKVLEVELEKKKGIKIYEIELLTSDGQVIELKFNAHTGEHLSTEIED